MSRLINRISRFNTIWLYFVSSSDTCAVVSVRDWLFALYLLESVGQETNPISFNQKSSFSSESMAGLNPKISIPMYSSRD
jgi:hypothetical protein